MKISKEEWTAWHASPCSQLLIKLMEERRKDIAEEILDLGGEDWKEQFLRYQGQNLGLAEALDLMQY